MGVDGDRVGAVVGCDTVGWEGVVGDEVEYFAGVASRRQWQGGRIPSEAVSGIGVASRAGRGTGRGTYFN